MNSRLLKSGKNFSATQTFTWFIPAPTQRKSGFRDREFDKVMKGILASGFELLELQTQATENGVFVIALLRATTKKAATIDSELDIQENFRLSDTHASSDIILDEDDEA